MACRLAIILCLILIANQSEGYIVDGVNGDDSNSGENVDDAFKTIARCVQSLRDRPIVLLIEGCKFAFKSCVYLRCMQCNVVENTLDAPEINANIEGNVGTLD